MGVCFHVDISFPNAVGWGVGSAGVRNVDCIAQHTRFHGKVYVARISLMKTDT